MQAKLNKAFNQSLESAEVRQRFAALGSEPTPGRGGAPPNAELYPANNPVLRPPVSGKVGLWSKTDNTSYFKDFVVSPK